jgi:DNA-binding LacI/PurR family transcriptional regulator
VAQDTVQGGRRLVEMLLARIDHRPVSSTVLPTTLVVRRSSGVPVATDTDGDTNANTGTA